MDVHTKTNLNLGRELYFADDFVAAEPHLLKVVEAHQGFADVHNMLGVIAQHRGDAGAARAHFEKAVAINARYTEAALNLSVVLNELGEYEAAKAVYERIASFTEPRETTSTFDRLDGFVRGKIANLHARVADAYVAVSLFNEAADELRRALSLCPTFVDLRTKLAGCLSELGHDKEAIDELTAVKESAPDFLPARNQLGLALWKAKRHDEAKAEWAFVLERNPDDRVAKLYASLER